MATSVLMRCGTSRPSEITSDWDTLLTSCTEERASLPPESERRAMGCLELKFQCQLDRSRAANLVQRIQTAALAAAAEIVV